MSFFGGDRRKHPRFNYHQNLQLNINFDHQLFHLTGLFQNISLSGCAFETKQIQINHHHLVLSSPNIPLQIQWKHHQDTLISNIEIRWYNWIKLTNLFHFGAQFMDPSKEFQSQIQQLIDTIKDPSSHE